MKIVDKIVDFYHHHPIFDHWPPFFKFEIFASFCYCFWTFFQPVEWGQLLTWYPAFTTGVTVYSEFVDTHVVNYKTKIEKKTTF